MKSPTHNPLAGLPDTDWMKSSRSGGNGGDCVETRRHSGMIEVRDSKDPSGPVLRFTAAEWEAFYGGAKDGEFDHLTQG